MRPLTSSNAMLFAFLRIIFTPQRYRCATFKNTAKNNNTAPIQKKLNNSKVITEISHSNRHFQANLLAVRNKIALPSAGNTPHPPPAPFCPRTQHITSQDKAYTNQSNPLPGRYAP